MRRRQKFVELGIRPKKDIEQLEPLESLPRTIVDAGKDEEVADAPPAVIDNTDETLQ